MERCEGLAWCFYLIRTLYLSHTWTNKRRPVHESAGQGSGFRVCLCSWGNVENPLGISRNLTRPRNLTFLRQHNKVTWYLDSKAIESHSKTALRTQPLDLHTAVNPHTEIM